MISFKDFLQIREDMNPSSDDPAHDIARQITPAIQEIIKSLLEQGKSMPEIMAILKDALRQSILLSQVPQGNPADWGQLPDSYEKWHT